MERSQIASRSTNVAGDGEPDTYRGAVAPLAAQDDFGRDVWNVFGVPIDAMTLPQAVAAVEAAIRARRKLVFVTPNVNMLCAARRDRSARQDILSHDLSFADGAPIVRLARLLGAPIRERVAGADLFEALRRRAAPAARRPAAFFFGGRPGAAKAAHQALNADDKSGLRSAGWLNPGFGDVDDLSRQEVIDEINAAAPDFLVVALGAAKGNAWIIRNAALIDAPVIAHLGAVVDFTGGGVARAPRLVARAGLEWLWRISQDPPLWRRYWRDGIDLLRLVLTAAVPISLRPVKTSGEAAAADMAIDGDTARVRLRGDHLAGDLAAARAAFRAAVASGHDVILDFSEACGLDAAFAGQALMLEKLLGASGARLAATGLTPPLRRYMKLSGLNIAEILDETPAAGAGRQDGVAASRQTA